MHQRRFSRREMAAISGEAEAKAANGARPDGMRPFAEFYGRVIPADDYKRAQLLDALEAYVQMQPITPPDESVAHDWTLVTAIAELGLVTVTAKAFIDGGVFVSYGEPVKPLEIGRVRQGA